MFDEKKFFEEMTSEEKTTEKTPIKTLISKEVSDAIVQMKDEIHHINHIEVESLHKMLGNINNQQDVYAMFQMVLFAEVYQDFMKSYHSMVELFNFTKEDIDEITEDAGGVREALHNMMVNSILEMLSSK